MSEQPVTDWPHTENDMKAWREWANGISHDTPLPPKLPNDYDQHHYLIVEGKTKHISKASAYILDMLTR